MDRRQFLKSLFAAGVATAINVDAAIEQTITDCVNMSDNDFVTYVRYSINLLVDNPARIAIITEIVE